MISLFSKLILNNYRNFSLKEINFDDKQILFTGNNGSGKTNILEALTLFGRSSSLRNDEFDKMINKNNNHNFFSLYAEFFQHPYIDNMAIKFDKLTKKKTFEFNNEIANKNRQNDLKNYLFNPIILSPQIEQLFVLGKSNRREYLDKIVCDIDLNHQSRLYNYQKLLKERLLILQKYHNNSSGNKWLDIVENKIAEIGIAIAFARIEAIEFFNKAILSFASNFPKPELKIYGDIEDQIINKSAMQIEDFYKEKFKNNRDVDLQNYKTEFGVHRTDFDAIFLPKNILATQSSTGEQKAIMISISLARVKISASYKNNPTILILDEIVSHLDNKRKEALCEEISMTNIQSFYSATSDELMPNNFVNKMQIINIES
jgi:DNA replication and repair protein RecF